MTDKKTWILLRGLGRERRHWGPFIEAFGRSFSGDEVLAIDLPGTGEFHQRSSPRDIFKIFQFVRAAAIERAKVQDKFHVLAVSLGGMVAMEWMRSRPEDLAGCVLVNTSVKTISPFYQRLRWQIWSRFFSAAALASPREREKALAEILINSPEAREQAVAIWARLASETPIPYKNILNQMWAAAHFKWHEKSVAVPTLLLCGLGDRLVDPSCSMALAEKMNWPLEKHPWGGHDLSWDDPNWILQRIHAWNGGRSSSKL